jgi:FtsX-like permease family protein
MPVLDWQDQVFVLDIGDDENRFHPDWIASVTGALDEVAKADGPRALVTAAARIRVQFLLEAVLLAFLGGAAGIASGALATAIYASIKHWAIIIPSLAWGGGIGAAIAIGTIAGLLPALRAARLPPTEALRNA